MRTTMALAAFCAVGAGGAVVGANSDVAMKGSDTLEDVTQEILASCGIPTSTTYIGGGSSAGEAALINAASGSTAQTIAPMSRFLRGSPNGGNPTGVCKHSGGPSTSEALAFALDGMAITADGTSASGCGGLAASGSFSFGDENGDGTTDFGGTYTLKAGAGGAAWRDALRLLYGGQPNDVAGNNLTANPKQCNSDARRALAKNWNALFEGECATCTDGIRHLWRRGDRSGTTDTFLSLVNLASMPAVGTNVTPTNSPFCNGGDFDDADPIRVGCSNDPTTAAHAEQVCGPDAPGGVPNLGNLGLLLPIFVPEGVGLSTADLYPSTPCTQGVFKYAAVPSGTTICPNGVPPVAAKCLAPVIRTGSTGAFTYNFSCLSNRTRPAGSVDGRQYNLVLRNSAGAIRRDSSSRQVTGAFYRIHTTASLSGVTCDEDTATKQIGCLTKASPCSIGFAGMEAIDPAVVNPAPIGVPVNGIAPTTATVQALVLTPSTADDYPLSRKLYLSTMLGFENVTGHERSLVECFSTRNPHVDNAVAATGFVPLPTGFGVGCEDFNDTTCGAATNVNACANNPSPIPTTGGAP
jgi:hypothetical protein